MNNEWSLEQEKEAVEAAQRDPREFARLYDQYADRVHRYLLVRAGHVQTAEDLTQETFLKALQALPHYAWRGLPFGAWLFRIARNTLISTVHRLQSTVAVSDEYLERIPAADVRLESQLDAVRVWERARAALTADQCEALTLRFKGELTIAEIAAGMKKSEAAIKMLLQRAIKTLAKKFS